MFDNYLSNIYQDYIILPGITNFIEQWYSGSRVEDLQVTLVKVSSSKLQVIHFLLAHVPFWHHVFGMPISFYLVGKRCQTSKISFDSTISYQMKVIPQFFYRRLFIFFLWFVSCVPFTDKDILFLLYFLLVWQ